MVQGRLALFAQLAAMLFTSIQFRIIRLKGKLKTQVGYHVLVCAADTCFAGNAPSLSAMPAYALELL